MAKFKIPKIVRPLDLAAYAPELAAEISAENPPIQMWVNPPRKVLERFLGLKERMHELVEEIREAAKGEPDQEKLQAIGERMTTLNGEFAEWWSSVWSQGDTESRWPPEDVRDFQLRCSEEDPALWDFVVEGCWALVREHRDRARKN